jgi:hypothetical protein
MAVKLCRKIAKAHFLRIIKVLWQSNRRCEAIQNEKYISPNGTYKLIYMISSKEFREILSGHARLLQSKIALSVNINDDYGRYSIKNYLNNIKRLTNTRHKNTLLRIWNGDCLSNTRLVHLRVVDTNLCPNCGMIDTPSHLLVECQVAVQTWDRLMIKIPKNPGTTLIEYAIGLYDGKIEMSIKAEILKMLMHFRSMEADAIHTRIRNYFMTTNSKNVTIRRIFA